MIDMAEILRNLANFMIFAVFAMFVENSVFARGFGVSRLVKLVGDSATDSMVFCALLMLVQVISAPLSFFATQFLSEQAQLLRGYVRPLVLVLCAIVAFALVAGVLYLLRPGNYREMLAVLPMATFNGAVLGPMLITSTQNFSFAATIGFALGSGLGYGFAVLIVSEGQRKLKSERVPSTFRGLPINLLYIGILAMAIYGFTGRQLGA